MNTRPKSEQRIIQKQGGYSSGQSRKKKADLRKAMQAVLDGMYTIKGKDGQTERISGTDAIVKTIMSEAVDKKSKNWQSAVRFVIQLTEQVEQSKQEAEKAQLELERLRAETELLKQKVKIINGEESGNGMLAELIDGLKG